MFCFCPLLFRLIGAVIVAYSLNLLLNLDFVIFNQLLNSLLAGLSSLSEAHRIRSSHVFLDDLLVVSVAGHNERLLEVSELELGIEKYVCRPDVVPRDASFDFPPIPHQLALLGDSGRLVDLLFGRRHKLFLERVCPNLLVQRRWVPEARKVRMLGQF